MSNQSKHRSSAVGSSSAVGACMVYGVGTKKSYRGQETAVSRDFHSALVALLSVLGIASVVLGVAVAM